MNKNAKLGAAVALAGAAGIFAASRKKKAQTVKIKNVQNIFKERNNAEIKTLSQEEKKKVDLIPNSIKWNSTNLNSLTKNKNVDKTLQEKTHSKPQENNNNEQKMTEIFVNLKYKNEQNILI